MIFKQKDTPLFKSSKKNATFELTACSKLGRDKLMNSNYQRAGIFALSHLQRGRSFNPSLQGTGGTCWGCHSRNPPGHQRLRKNTWGSSVAKSRQKSTTLVKKNQNFAMPGPCSIGSCRPQCVLVSWEQTRHCKDGEGWDSVSHTQNKRNLTCTNSWGSL